MDGKKEDRSSPVRISRKSEFIIKSVLDANKTAKKTEIIEDSLSLNYPHIAKNYTGKK